MKRTSEYIMSAAGYILVLIAVSVIFFDLLQSLTVYLPAALLIVFIAGFTDFFIEGSPPIRKYSKKILAVLTIAATSFTFVWYMNHPCEYKAFNLKRCIAVFTGYTYIMFYIDHVLKCSSAKKCVLSAFAASFVYTVHVAVFDFITLFTSVNYDINDHGDDYHWPFSMAVKCGFMTHYGVYTAAFAVMAAAAAAVLICRFTAVGKLIKRHTKKVDEYFFQ